MKTCKIRLAYHVKFAYVFQDYVGLRGVFAVVCAFLTLPVFGLLAFTFVPPLVSTIWLGVTYSFAAVCLAQTGCF